MADYDPEVMRELMGNLDALNASLGPLATRMGQMSGALDAQGNALNKDGEAIKKATNYREGEVKAVQETIRAQNDLKKAAEHLKQGFTAAGSAATSFADTLLKGEGKFSSYNKAIDGAGDAAWQLGKAFGPLGMAIGGAIKAVSKVAQVMTEQADAQNEFVGEMYKMGAISGQSSEKLTDMARAAGYAAEDLNKLVPIMKKAGAGLTTLGGTTGQGADALGKLLKAANENERAFFRIGYSLEELQETQAEYLELQRQSGVNLRQRGFDEEKLAKDSLKYAQNLRELSDLTGQSAETLKQEQMSARNAYENVIAARAEEAKIRQMEAELANTTDQARREQLQKEIDEMKNATAVRNEAIGRMANDFGPEFGAQFGKVLRTGAFDESTKGLAVLGISAADLKKRFEGVKEGTPEFDRLMAETAQEIRQKQDERIGQFNQSLQYGGEELGKQLGLSKEAVMRGGMIDPNDEAARREQVKADIEGKMAGNDAQRDLAAALVDNERKIKTAADELLDSMNPLTNGVDKTTLAMQALTVAAGIAAATMMMGGKLPGLSTVKNVGSKAVSAIKAAPKAISQGVKAAPGALKTGATALKTGQGFVGTGAGSTAMKALGRLAGPLAAVTEVAGGVMSAMEGRERAEKNLAEGRITKEEADRRKTQETAEGAGQAVGGASGALAGAAAGAAIGSVVPVIGTAIGGIIGGIAGAWLGSKGGEEIGGAIGEKMTISPEVEEQNERNRQLVSEMGIYNENWLGASEVNMEKLREGIESGKVTNDMINAMIQDNDLTDAQMEELTALQAENQDKLKENLEKQLSSLEATTEQQQSVATAIEEASAKAIEVQNLEQQLTEAQSTEQKALIEEQLKVAQEQLSQSREAANALIASAEESGAVTIEQAQLVATKSFEVKDLEQRLLEETDVKQKELLQQQLDAAKKDLEASKAFEETIKGPFESAIAGIGNMFSNIGGWFGFGGDDEESSASAPAFGGGGAGGASGGTADASSAIGGGAAGASGGSGGSRASRGTGGGGGASGGSDSGASAGRDSGGSAGDPSSWIGSNKRSSGAGGQMSEQDIKDMIKEHEGVRTRPYKDSLGLWTVGVGHLIGDGKSLPSAWNREFSMSEVNALFDKDYEKHKKEAQSNVPGFNKFDSMGKGALIDLTFNMGGGWPRKFPNTSRKLGAGDTEGAARGLEDSLWYTQVGRRAPKIVNMVRNSKVTARDGGLTMGPESGYPATLHGNEMIVPSDTDSALAKLGKIPLEKDSVLAKLGKISSGEFDLSGLALSKDFSKSSESLDIGKSLDISSLTGALTDMTSTLTKNVDIESLTGGFADFTSNLTKNFDIGSLTSGITDIFTKTSESFSKQDSEVNLDPLSRLTDMMTVTAQDLSGIGLADIGSLIEKLGKPETVEEEVEEKAPMGDDEIYAMISTKLDTMIDKLDGQNGAMVGVLEKHLTQMVSKLDDNNDIQGKMLQYSKV